MGSSGARRHLRLQGATGAEIRKITHKYELRKVIILDGGNEASAYILYDDAELSATEGSD